MKRALLIGRALAALGLGILAGAASAAEPPPIPLGVDIQGTVSSPTTATAGGSLAVTTTAKAVGGSTGSFTIKLYLSTDSLITATDLQIGSRSVSKLANNGSSTATTTCTVPATAGGPYYVGAIFDSANTVSEADESNNAVAGNVVTVQGRDLTMTALSGSPTTVATGATLTIANTVKSTTAVSSFTINFYLSSDATITPGQDLLLGSRTVSSLAAGASSSASSAFTVPAQAGGAMYVGAFVDATQVIAESNEANNYATGNQITVTRPDLTMSALSVSPATVPAGGVVSVTDTVASTAAVGTFYVNYYLSADAIQDASDVSLGSRKVTSLAAGASSTATTSLTLPAQYSGSRYLIAVADGTGVVAESNESNNGRAVVLQVTPPDLTVTAVSVTPNPVPSGGTITVTDTVRSAGAASPTFHVYFYLSADAALSTATDHYLGARTVSALAKDQTSSGTTTFTIPSQRVGIQYLIALADGGAIVAETNEGNNALASSPLQISQPDLRPTYLAASPATVPAGGTITVSDTVTASGGATGTFYVNFYLSSDPTIAPATDEYLGRRTVTGLAAGASSTGTTSFTLPARLSGPYWVGAVVDATGVVAESDEGNNVITGNAIQIVPPDLTVSSLSWTLVPGDGSVTPIPGDPGGSGVTAVPPGSTLKIADEVTATGGAAETFYVVFYLSDDGVITPGDDTYLGYRAVNGLVAGGKSAGTTYVSLPAADVGTRYIGAVVDGTGIVVESNETNNAAAAGPLTILKPDLYLSLLQVQPPEVESGDLVTVSYVVMSYGATSTGCRVGIYVSWDPEITTADRLVGYRDVPPLVLDEWYSDTFEFPIPWAGELWVGALVDDLGQVAETDESNNVMAGAVLITEPDLRVASVTAFPTEVAAQGIITTSAEVVSDGHPATDPQLCFYLSIDTAIDATDVELWCRDGLDLATGVPVVVSGDVAIPPGVEGPMYVGAMFNPHQTFPDWGPGPNALAGNVVVIRKPDIAIAALTATPETLGAGGTLTVADTVTISGGDTVPFRIHYFLSRDRIVSPAEDVYLGERWMPGTRGTYPQSTPFEVPLGLSGTWYVAAVADPGGDVTEQDEGNNVAVGNAITITKPDLAVTSVAGAPVNVPLGGALTVTDSVRSTGGGTGPFTVRFYLSRDRALSGDDVTLGERTVAGLADGATSTATTTHAIVPGLGGGPWYLGAIVDAAGTIDESDEGNNAAIGTFHQLGPDTQAPEVVISGVTDGLVTAEFPLTACFEVSDPNLASVEATLDGLPVAGCADVYLEDDHVLLVRATDAFGNVAERRIAFAIDLTTPTIAFSGVANGQITNAASVTPAFVITEAHLASVTATLDGLPFASGTPVSAEDDHVLSVTATDAAGHARTEEVTFALDRTAPSITIHGVEDGGAVAVSVAPDVTIAETHPGTSSITLDGASWVPGTTVEAEGDHTIAAQATDAAGNHAEKSVSFAIDRTAPAVTIVSPAGGSVTAAATVEVVATATDAHGIAVVTVNGTAVPAGPDGRYVTTLTLAEGANPIEVAARDRAGNPATKAITVRRDTAKPALEVAQPIEDATFPSGSVTVSGTATDDSALVVAVNGAEVPLGAGGAFTTTLQLGPGAQAVTVVATDAAGNASTVVRNVTVASGMPQLAIAEPAPGFVATRSPITVRGTAKVAGGGSLTVTVNEKPVTLSGETFSTSVEAAPGPVTITVTASAAGGQSVTKTVSGTLGTDQPPTEPPQAGTLVLAIDSPAEGAIAGQGTVEVSGRVEGGTPPLAVKVSGQPALLNSGYFGLALPLVEGDHTILVEATDAAGKAVYAQRTVTVDHTAPYLVVTRPATSPAQASESPYLVEGTVGDVHLAQVTVAGQPATVLAGQFSRAVPLQVGDNAIDVVARDAAGNSTTRTVTLSIGALPPSVTILEPADGSAASSAVVRVRAHVESTSQIQSVTIGSGSATQESGDWVADVALALGENVLSVVASDASGLTGSATVHVKYSDPTLEPLAVTGVDPTAGASEVEPNALVSVSFNKPVRRDGIDGRFTLSVEGTPLAGGYYVAPGEQTVSFVAKQPLPEGKRVDVRVDGVPPAAGPGMTGAFTSQFAVRERRIEVVGHVLDAQLQPIENVQVSIEGGTLSTRTGPEGSWHLLGARPGTAILRYEGGALGNGQSLPVIRRRLFVSGTADTKDQNLVMVPTDRGAVEYVDSRSALHLGFAGVHGPLAVDVPADGLYFEDGKTSGFVTATRIPQYALPVPIDDGRTVPESLWQLQPAGIRLTRPVQITFPNVSGLAAGRYAIVHGYDPARHMLERVGLARVAEDGATLSTVQPTGVSALDFFGYSKITDEQQAWIDSNLPGGVIPEGPPGSTGMRFDPYRVPARTRPTPAAPAAPELPLLARFLMSPLGSGPARAFLPPWAFGGFPEPKAGYAFVNGKIRSPQELEFEIAVQQGVVGQPIDVDLPYPHKVTFVAVRTDKGSTAGIEIKLRAQRGQTVISAPANENWSPPVGAGQATVSGTVTLEPGTTLITAEALSYRTSRTTRLEAKVEELAPVTDPATGKQKRRGRVTVRQLVETDPSFASKGMSFFSGWPVEVTSASDYVGVSGSWGQFSVPVWSYGGEQGALVCTEVQTGLRWIVQADKSDAENPKLVQWPIIDGFPVCQTLWNVAPDSYSPVSLLVDMRVLTGSLVFYNRDETTVPFACEESEKTTWDPQKNELTQLALDDVGQTEVYFFKEDDLKTPIARYVMAVPPAREKCSPELAAWAEYNRLRFGPSERWTRRDREECERLKAAGTTTGDFYKFTCEGQDRVLSLRLSEGDHVVVFAVNHATGYAGATMVVVPPITTGLGLDADGKCPADEQLGGPITFPDFGEQLSISRCAREDLRIFANLRMYPPEIDVRVGRKARAEGAPNPSAPEQQHLIRHGGSATVRDDFIQVSTHWRVRLPPEDLDGDGTPNVTDKCPKIIGPPGTFGCPDPKNPGWQPPPRLMPPPAAPPPIAVTGIPSTGGTSWPYQYSGATPGPAVDPFDADGDGIPDVAYDRDADGTSDVADRCPTLKGDAANGGCPAGTDGDHDGTPDASDACVAQPGPPETAGCPDPSNPYWTPLPPEGEPDSDSDGVPDAQDLCPLYAGPASTPEAPGPNGCPSLLSRFDTDEDGTPDPNDDCIWQQGPPEKLGCPDPARTDWAPPTPAPKIAGGPGKMLETYCSELTNPTPDEIKICTKLEARLMDVPPGVPPLAGQLVRVTGTAVEKPAVAVFPVSPGKGTSNVQVALRLQNPVVPPPSTSPDGTAAKTITTNLAKANYYVHVVGNLTLFNDKNGDRRIDPATEIAVSPPAFNEPKNPPQGWKAGMPERAIALKDVYKSMEPDGAQLARFDRDREHEFRVLDLALTSVTAPQPDGTTRSVNAPADGTAHVAMDGDLSYQILMQLIAPETPGRAGTLPGTYQVRIGTDDYAVDCAVKLEGEALTATCDNAWLFDVLSGRDIVYIGLSMSGNAENILYKYNLHGLTPRMDLVTAGHGITAAKSIAADDSNGNPAVLRSISEPALANVFVGPTTFKRGTVKFCVKSCTGTDLLREFDLDWQDSGSFKVTEVAGRGAIEQVPGAGLSGAALFRLPVPNQHVDMPGRNLLDGVELAPELFVKWRNKDDPNQAATPVLKLPGVELGKARGVYDGANGRAPGQAGIGGVNVADGHVSFRHEDFSLPEFASRVRFERTYNNQDNEIGTLGIGWRHNLEAYVVEERPGRYTMVLEGQSYDFPSCTLQKETDGRESWVDCKTDKAHGGVLTVKERPEEDPKDPKHIPDVLFVAPNGVQYRFDRYSQKALQTPTLVDAYVRARQVQDLAEYQYKKEDTTAIKTAPPRKKIRDAGRRRWVLTAIDEGHGRADEAKPLIAGVVNPGKGWTVLEYFADSDMLRRVYRKGGKLGLYFSYEAVDLQSSLSPWFKAAAVAENFGLLRMLEARFQSEAGDGTMRNANPDGTPKDPDDYVVRLTFARDGRGNLTSVPRIQAELKQEATADQEWAYTYADLSTLAAEGTRLSGREMWEASNEIASAELRIGGVAQWRTSWRRTLSWTKYPHARLFEIVDRVTLPGTSDVFVETNEEGQAQLAASDVETEILWVEDAKRKIVRPDRGGEEDKRVVVEVDLNGYGSVSAETVGIATATTTWFNSSDEKEKVAPKERTAPGGRKLELDATDRLQPISTTVRAAGTGDTLPLAHGGGTGTVVGQTLTYWDPVLRDKRFGVPEKTTRITAEGTADWLAPADDLTGDPLGLSVKEGNADLVRWEANDDAYDVEGVLKKGSQYVLRQSGDTSRLETVYADTSPANAWGLRPVATTTLAGPGLGGLATVTRTSEHDWLGRVVRVHDSAGHEEEWTYDAVGRLTRHRVAGTPDQVFNYEYQSIGSRELRVVETLEGIAGQREKLYYDGLLVHESWTYGPANLTASRSTSYVGGKTKTVVDERRVSHDHRYDKDGRLERIVALDTANPSASPRDEVVYERDKEGKVLEETDYNGLTVTTAYDELGRAARWSYGPRSGDFTGEDVERTARDPGGVVAIREHGSYTWKSKIDALGRVRSVEAQGKPEELNTVTDYDALGRKVYSWDSVLGVKEEWFYEDVLGRLTRYTRSVEPYSETFDQSYSYADGDEHTVEIVEKVGSRVAKERKLWLDAMGRTLHTVDYVPGVEGIVEAHRYFEYDARGNVIRTREPIGDGPTQPEAEATTATTAVSTQTYDAAGNLLSATDPKGTVTAYTVDPSGLVLAKDGPHPDEHWTYRYDVFGQLERKALEGPRTAGPTWSGGTWTYQYRVGNGATVRETDPLGYQTDRWYNARHELLKEVRTDAGASRSSSNEQITIVTYDGPWVSKQETIEGASRSTLLREGPGYDHRGRVLDEEERYSGPDGVGYTYELHFDWSGRDASITQRWSAPLSGFGQRFGSREVDGLENVISQQWGVYEDRFGYDAAGRLVFEKAHASPSTSYLYEQGLLVSETLAGSFDAETTLHAYWASGKLRTTTRPDTRSRVLTWNERGLLAKEEFGRDGDFDTKEYQYDGGGNVERMAHGTVAQDRVEWQYQTGPRGELWSVQQPGDIGKFVYQYDARTQLTGILTPPGSVMPGQGFDHDYLGRQVLRRRGSATWTTEWDGGAATELEPQETDANLPGGRRSVRRIIDPRGRVVVQQFSGVGSDLREVHTSFDPLDQPLGIREVRGSGEVTVGFTYDDDRRLLLGIARGNESVLYLRTPSGQLQWTQSPAGAIVNYTYDDLDRLDTIAMGGRTTSIDWDPGGERLSLVASEAFDECRRYDNRGRVTIVASVPHGDRCEDSFDPLADFRYGYDDRGNRTSEEYRDPTLTLPERTSYGYDGADRLTGVQYPGNSAMLYQLAPDGSRLAEKQVTGFGLNLGPGGFDMNSGDTSTYGYDGLGGLRSILGPDHDPVATFQVDVAGRVRSETRGTESKAFTWDASSRLVSATVTKALAGGGSGTETLGYKYDFAGRRVEKTSSAGTTKYVWGGDDLVEEVSPGGTRLMYERWGALVTGVTPYTGAGPVGPSERFLHDGLDSIVGRVRSDGTSIAYRYDAWGNFRGAAAPGSGETTLAYAGQHWDAELGLSYAQQRWYDPGVGRFLSEDPVFGEPQIPASLLTFGYANGNPLMFVDADGRKPFRTAPESIQNLVGTIQMVDLESLADDQLRGYLALYDDEWGVLDYDFSRREAGTDESHPLYLVHEAELAALDRDTLLATVCQSLSCRDDSYVRAWRKIAGSEAAKALVQAWESYDEAWNSVRQSAGEIGEAEGRPMFEGLNVYNNPNISNPDYKQRNADATRRAQQIGGGVGRMTAEGGVDALRSSLEGKAASGTVVGGTRAARTGLKRLFSAIEKLGDDAVGQYRRVKGHHVHMKSAFKGHVTYDPKKGFSVSPELMEEMNWNHEEMTKAQRALSKQLARSGRANGLPEQSRIALQALMKGGATREEAEYLVRESLKDLAAQGVKVPTHIPWSRK